MDTSVDDGTRNLKSPHMPSGNNGFDGVVQEYTSVARELQVDRVTSRIPPANIIMFGDFGRDPDDDLALCLLAGHDVTLPHSQSIPLCRIVAVIANLVPQELRARHAKQVLIHAGLPNIPVASGSSATDQIPYEDPDPALAEFGPEVMKTMVANQDLIHKDGGSLVYEILQDLDARQEKATILCTTWLRDLAEFIRDPNCAAVFKSVVNRVVLQGGQVIFASQLLPDVNATNNAYDTAAAKMVYHFLQESGICSSSHRNSAGRSAPLPASLFKALRKTGGPTADHLVRRHSASAQSLWQRSCLQPEYRVLPRVTGQYVLMTLTDIRPEEWDSLVDAEMKAAKYGRHVDITHNLQDQPAWDLLAAIDALDSAMLRRLSILRPDAQFGEDAGASTASVLPLGNRTNGIDSTATAARADHTLHVSIEDTSLCAQRAVSMQAGAILYSLNATAKQI